MFTLPPFGLPIRLCSYLGMFKLMLIPELVRRDIVFIQAMNEKEQYGKLSSQRKFRGKSCMSACDLHQALRTLQSSCTDINHESTAIKILLITIGLTELYLDQFSVICEVCSKKYIVDCKMQHV